MPRITISKISKKLINLIFQFQILRKKNSLFESWKNKFIVHGGIISLILHKRKTDGRNYNFWTKLKASLFISSVLLRQSKPRYEIRAITKYLLKRVSSFFSLFEILKSHWGSWVWKVVDGIVNGRGRFLETSQPLCFLSPDLVYLDLFD